MQTKFIYLALNGLKIYHSNLNIVKNISENPISQ